MRDNESESFELNNIGSNVRSNELGCVAPLTTLDGLSNFDVTLFPVTDHEGSTTVPLRKCRNGPKMLVCHDLMGGYHCDKWNGDFHIRSRDDVTYRFLHWPYVDVFVYFSHNLVTIPPSGWITAAHLHEVLVLGTFITEWENGKNICDSMLQSEETCFFYAEKLVDVAVAYKFDGWLVNIENKLQILQIELMLKFLKHLTKQCHKRIGEHAQVIWYDSVTTSGDLKWQNELNELNKPYFDICSGIFLNYTWKPNNLKLSLENAGQRAFDVFVGIDVFGRGCIGGGGFNTCEAMQELYRFGLSSALFAPGWLYETLPKVEFCSNSQRFWHKLKPYLKCRSVTALPMQTSFNSGLFFKHCEDTGNKELCLNIGRQDLQPHFLCNVESALHYNYMFAEDWSLATGSCLKLSFARDNPKPLSRCCFVYKLRKPKNSIFFRIKFALLRQNCDEEMIVWLVGADDTLVEQQPLSSVVSVIYDYVVSENDWINCSVILDGHLPKEDWQLRSMSCVCTDKSSDVDTAKIDVLLSNLTVY